MTRLTIWCSARRTDGGAGGTNWMHEYQPGYCVPGWYPRELTTEVSWITS